MSVTTFEEIAKAASKLSTKEKVELVDLLQETVAIPDEAMPGIKEGIADLEAGRVAKPQDLAAIAAKINRLRTA